MTNTLMIFKCPHRQKPLAIIIAIIWSGLLSTTSLAFSLQVNAAGNSAINKDNGITTEKAAEYLRQALRASIDQPESFDDRFDAEVWLVAMSEKLKRYIKDPEKRFSFLQKIHYAATQAKLNPELVLAVIQVESAFNPYAVSYVGAQGMMQVMPFWKKEIGRTDDNLIHLETNLRYGCTILRHYIDREKGHIANALARYNGSYGSTKYSRKVMTAWLDYWR
ncbi:MAG: soluble lytic murein transglycosylase-like protein [Candidatus Endobugula sp.]|jgi:soluble lytic murein transglycosylase-like protein